MIFLKKLGICFFVFFMTFVEARNFILMAKPGSGKGAFSQYMIEKYGYVQICAGDIFRHEILQQTELGKKIQQIVEQGKYVDEDIACELMRQHLLKALSENKKFILDGFPRSDYALSYIKFFLKEHNLSDGVCFIKFDALDAVCLERILGRIVCNNCFRVYSSKSLLGEKNCQKCGALLSKRMADLEEIVGQRLEHFRNTVEPLFESIRKDYSSCVIDTENSLDDLYRIYDELA